MGEMTMGVHELMFVNSDATPKVSAVHVSLASVPAIMAWYGGYYAGDRYTVSLDGRRIEKDRNGECSVTLGPARRRGMVEMTDWLDIDTVPRDGTRVLLGWSEGTGDYALGPVAIGSYNAGRLWLDNADDNEKLHPSHWQPLPDRPAK